MRKQNYTGSDRKKLEEDLGQINFFDDLDNKKEIINETKEENKQEFAKLLDDNPIGIKSEGKNIDIEEILQFQHFSLDEFSGQEAPYSDMFVGFDLKKEPTDKKFIVVSEKEYFSNLKEFKEETGCEMAFAQKEDTECYNVVALYEKRIEVSKIKDKKNNKAADKEAKAILEDERTGYSSEELDIKEPTEKKDSKNKIQKRNRI